LDAPGGNPVIHVFLSNQIVLAIVGSRQLVAERPNSSASPPMVVSKMRPGRKFYSRWLPKFVRAPLDKNGIVAEPKYRATSVIEHRNRWFGIMGKCVDGVTAAVLSGKLTNPRRQWPLVSSWLPNHPSWENNTRAREILGKEIGKYLITDALEYVPPWVKQPLFVEPIGAVDNPGPKEFRMITDARKGNKFIDDWGVHYWTIWDLAAMLDWGDILFADDLRASYHNGYLAGCTGELRWILAPFYTLDDNGTLHVAWKFKLQVGCTAEDCFGFCDRAMNGMCIDGHVFRWLTEHFGHKVAGSPLNALMLCILRFLARPTPGLGELRGASSKTLIGAVWVDDTVLVDKVPPHGRCQGIRGDCVTCIQHLAHAKERQAFWIWLGAELGLEFAEDKRQNPDQVIRYTGLIADTVLGLLFVPDDKLPKIVDDLQFILGASALSPQFRDHIRGRLQHYSAGLKHIRVYAAIFLNDGDDLDHPCAESRPNYTEPVPFSPALLDACRHLLWVIDT